jgi:hypothetical protein
MIPAEKLTSRVYVSRLSMLMPSDERYSATLYTKPAPTASLMFRISLYPKPPPRYEEGHHKYNILSNRTEHHGKIYTK